MNRFETTMTRFLPLIVSKRYVKDREVKDLEFNPNTPLYTIDAKAWRLEQLDEVLSQLYAHGKPVIVFVHGRGKEPNKSLRGATFVEGLAVPKIELGYDASVLMFNWDSAFPGVFFKNRKRALGNVGAAANQLGLLLSGMAASRQAFPYRSAPALLAHSMGTIVVQKTVEASLWPTGNAIFSHVVLSQPDADDGGHAKWLSQLGARENVLVTMNNDDRVLLQSTKDRPAGSHALGLGTSVPLAQNVRYVDLTNMGAVGSEKDDDHEVFGKGAMNGQVHVCQFFEQALLGKQLDLSTATNVESIDRNVVYKLKAKFDPTVPCLRQPKLPHR